MIQPRFVVSSSDQPRGERPPLVVSVDELRALRSAPPAEVRSAGLADDVAVPLRAVCARAHRAGLRVEEVLVQVKQVWRELPEARRLEALASRDEQLDRIVTALIERFYRDDDSRSA